MRYKLGRFMDSDDEELSLSKMTFLRLFESSRNSSSKFLRKLVCTIFTPFPSFCQENPLHISRLCSSFCVNIILRGGFRLTQGQL